MSLYTPEEEVLTAGWAAEIERLPQWELEAEIEYADRRVAEIAQGVDVVDGILPAESWTALLEVRLGWLVRELDRRSIIETKTVRFAPRRFDVAYLDDLRSRVPLHTFLVERYDVALKASGSGYAGRCPFHDDRHPSLYVWPQEERWWCFTCAVGGDVFDLVLTSGDAHTFRDAVGIVAEYADVPLPIDAFRLNGRAAARAARLRGA